MSWASRTCRLTAVAVALIVAVAAPTSADVVLDEQFDGPSPTWRVRPAAGVRVLAQQRTQAPHADRPTSAERLVLLCPPGYAAQLERTVGNLPVLDELTIEVVLRANRPGVQLAAEIVFPRTNDPATGKPVSTMVHGLRYSEPGQWQNLRLTNVPLLARRRARLISIDPKVQVDVAEAYVSHVVLVVPGDPNESLVETDQLTVVGVSPTLSKDGTNNGTTSSDAVEGPLLQAPGTGSSQQRKSFEPVAIRRNGNTIAVAGVPIVPRVLQHRGEPFDFVAEMGFNAVWLEKPATEAQLHAARAARLWVVCPPPNVDQLARIPVDSIWQTVLAWSLGLDHNGAALDQVASTVDEVRRTDPLGRPVLVGAADRPRRFGRLADVLVRPAEQPLDDSTPPLRQQALSIMGCSPWTQLSLGWSEQATTQAQLLAPRARHLGWHHPNQIHNAALQTVAAGARGLVVRTPERLGRTYPETRQLIEELQLLNRELTLIEPWLVSGKRTPSAEVTGAEAAATVWQLGQSHLTYIPQQALPLTAQPSAMTLVVAGVPETAKAHSYSPAGLLPLSGGRVAGGYRVQLGQFAAGGFVLLTDDSRALAVAQKRIGRSAAQAAQVSRGLAASEVAQLEALRSQLVDLSDRAQTARMKGLKQKVQKVDQYLASRDYPRVAHMASQVRYDAAAELARIRSGEQSAGFGSVATQFVPKLLPTHQAIEQSIRGLPRGPNLLAGGDFEDLNTAVSAGWLHATYADAKVSTAVELSPQEPYHGNACLRLNSRAVIGEMMAHDVAPQPVVWITSPRLAVTPGGVFEVTGWARVATQTGSQRGELLIVDTLGGEQLAIRIPATTGWRQFRMVRTADDSGQLQLNLALTGPASADIDAVMVREVIRPRRTATRTETDRTE